MLILEGCLLLAFLGHNQAERFASLARQNGAGGATAIPAKGTASSKDFEDARPRGQVERPRSCPS